MECEGAAVSRRKWGNRTTFSEIYGNYESVFQGEN